MIALRYKDARSDKTYSVEQQGTLVIVKYGPFGRAQKTLEYPHSTDSEARKFAIDLEKKKLAKGYMPLDDPAFTGAPAKAVYCAGLASADVCHVLEKTFAIEIPRSHEWAHPIKPYMLKIKRAVDGDGDGEFACSAVMNNLDHVAVLGVVALITKISIVDERAVVFDFPEWVRVNRHRLDQAVVELLEDVGALPKTINFNVLKVASNQANTWSANF